jgi:TRAP-type C4-dicarboxylate transport system substrate-binding protein
MVRKRWLIVRIFAATLLATGLSAVARADQIVLKAASAFPKPHQNNVGFFHFIDAVNKAGKGEIHIDFI